MSETALMVPSNLSHNVSALIEIAKIHLTKLPSLGGSIDPLQHAAVKAEPMAGMMSSSSMRT
jgi:hypothetical protein